MVTVMAQGTFDLLHPGHIHYLKKSAELGEELIVVIARDSRASKHKDLIFDEEERREIIDALDSVNKAVLGAENDIYTKVKEIDPDIITLGHDQHHDENEVKKMAENATGKEIKVERIEEHGYYSSSQIKSSVQ